MDNEVFRFLFSSMLFFVVLVSMASRTAVSATDPGDYAVLMDIKNNLKNPEILNWSKDDDDPCGSRWPHVYCKNGRVAQIQVQNCGLEGTLPPSFSKLTALTNLGLQKNNFSGPLPTFKNFANLQYAFLDFNNFSSIPSDFFVGLTSLQVLALDSNPLNASTGWTLPDDLAASAQLMNLTLGNCNLAGEIPEFLGSMASLTRLTLSGNSLTGPIPSSFAGSSVQILWLNGQNGPGLSGTLDVLASMPSLQEAILGDNNFSGRIPEGMSACTELSQLWLERNYLVGLLPVNVTSLPKLTSLKVDDNKLMGPIPKVKYNFTYSGNNFCSPTPGDHCSADVMTLLGFLDGLDYPFTLVQSWGGSNQPCGWPGISCSVNGVTGINLPRRELQGTISPALGNLTELTQINLSGNKLTGTIPASLAGLKALKSLKLANNNLSPPVPNFANGVEIDTSGNPYLNGVPLPPPPPPGTNPSPPSPDDGHGDTPPSPGTPSGNPPAPAGGGTKVATALVVAVPVIVGVAFIAFVVLFFIRRKNRKGRVTAPTSVVVHPRDPSDPDHIVKIVVTDSAGIATSSSGDVSSGTFAYGANVHMVESGNLMISVQVLRQATRNFAPENVLGKGGFGVVYKGVLDDGTMIAVKRMEAMLVSCKANNEFEAEIDVLGKVRHRNLVSLLGYSVEGSERLLVYEFMPQGALSKHLFHWKHFNIEPLSWRKRLYIALDVARGMEYLHDLSVECYIHRDLKSSNILLGDDHRAKVSDFGLAKLAPGGQYAATTRLAGTFGYLAPEYAVAGKITTKTDVFSFGVVLMELITGLVALDENREEETRHLATWFHQIKSSPESLRGAVDPALDLTDETFECISKMAELAGHCTAREAPQRPDMGYAVSILAPMVDKWKPMADRDEEFLGIDYHLPLHEMVKGWQSGEDSLTIGGSTMSLDDSKGSIPARPAGFAESFTSADGR